MRLSLNKGNHKRALYFRTTLKGQGMVNEKKFMSYLTTITVNYENNTTTNNNSSNNNKNTDNSK